MGKVKSIWTNDESSKMISEMAKARDISDSKLINRLVKKDYKIFKSNGVKK